MPTSPTEEHPTHHLSLTDGENIVDLILCNRQGAPTGAGWQKANTPKSALRVNQAVQGYGDFEMPFSSVVQSDWAGGRGARDFDKDTTRFNDSYRLDTRKPGEIRCGPKTTQGTAYAVVFTTGASTSTGTLTTSATAASSFTPTADITVRSLLVNLNIVATGSLMWAVPITATLWSHSVGTGYPNLVLVSSKMWLEPNKGARDYTFPIAATALTSGTKYWCEIKYEVFIDAPEAVHSTVYTRVASSGQKIAAYSGSSWSDVVSNIVMSFSILSSGLSGTVRFFDYKGMKMAVTLPEDGSTPRLFVNGYYGAAESNSGDKTKLYTTKTNITENALVGKIARIIEGPGYREAQNWRAITANTNDGDGHCHITVSPPWNITHSATTPKTIWVIDGLDTWTEITGLSPGFTAAVTDVIVVNDWIYFGMGQAALAIKVRYYDASWSSDQEGSVNADFLALSQDDKGTPFIWIANMETCQVWEAALKTSWPDDLSIGTPIVCGSTNSKITGLMSGKVSGSMLPIVFKEDGFGSISGSGSTTKIFDWYRQFPEVRERNNGTAHIMHDVYLWFSLLEGVERFYDQRLDDIGPQRDEGLPSARRGMISAMVEYASRVYVAVDGGQYGTSCVLEHNSTGWHEVYRGAYGKRIRGLGIQVIPGFENSDRLWIAEGEDIYWLPISLNPKNQAGYKYFSGSELETAWITSPFKDLPAYWDSLTLFTENLSGTSIYVEAYYKADTDTSWTALGNTYTFRTSPVEELRIGNRNVTGRRIKFKLIFYTGTETVSPVLYAMRANMVVRVKPKGVWNVTGLIVDNQQANLEQVIEYIDADAKIDQLEAWQDGSAYPAPLLLSSVLKYADNKMGFVDGVSVVPIVVNQDTPNWKLATLVQFTFIEV